MNFLAANSRRRLIGKGIIPKCFELKCLMCKQTRMEEWKAASSLLAELKLKKLSRVYESYPPRKGERKLPLMQKRMKTKGRNRNDE
jgi:hypothetical protein